MSMCHPSVCRWAINSKAWGRLGQPASVWPPGARFWRKMGAGLRSWPVHQRCRPSRNHIGASSPGAPVSKILGQWHAISRAFCRPAPANRPDGRSAKRRPPTPVPSTPPTRRLRPTPTLVCHAVDRPVASATTPTPPLIPRAKSHMVHARLQRYHRAGRLVGDTGDVPQPFAGIEISTDSSGKRSTRASKASVGLRVACCVLRVPYCQNLRKNFSKTRLLFVCGFFTISCDAAEVVHAPPGWLSTA